MEIECSFGVVGWIGGSFYTCTVKSSSITKPGTKVTSCNGLHQAGKSDADVAGIYFNSLVVEYFPLGLGKIFPNLKHLQVYKCGLKEISQLDLKGLEGLTGLWLDFNELKSLPDNLFSGMTKLTRVNFSGNKLEFVSSKLLQPIKNNKLNLVNFSDNPTEIGFFEPPRTSASLGSLKQLCDIIDKNCKKPMETRQYPVDQDFPEHLVKGFKELWASKRVSDFVIVCGSKEFQVHKPVLLIQSSVLAAVVESDMQENKTGRMEIKDFSKEAVEDFLKYLYTGETPDATNAMEIFALAYKYDVLSLKTLMEEIILTNLDTTNAFEVLTMGKQHNCENLVQAAFAEIQIILGETKLNPSLIDNLKQLKGLIEMKREYEKYLKIWLLP